MNEADKDNMTEGGARPSTASVDRRVGRLEDRQDEMQRSIDRLEITMIHQSDMAKARFDAMDANITGLSATINGFMSDIRATNLQSVANYADPTATPAGRSLLSMIEALKVNDMRHDERMNSIKAQVMLASGGLAVIMFVITVIAPYIQAAINAPGI